MGLRNERHFNASKMHDTFLTYGTILSIPRKQCPEFHRTKNEMPKEQNSHKLRIKYPECYTEQNVTFFIVVLAFSIPLCSNYSIFIKPSNTTM